MTWYLGLELDLPEKTVQPGTLSSIFEIEAGLDYNWVAIFLYAELEWFQSHTKYYHLGADSLLKVWDAETEGFSEASFLSLKLFVPCLFVKAKIKHNDNTVNIAINLPPKAL